MNYKLSFYNIVVKNEAGATYIWNVKKGSVVELENDIWELLQKGEFQNPRVVDDVSALEKEGIIVEKNLDEYSELIFKAKQKQFSTSYNAFGLVIAPTLDCNYHCPYCFEHTVKEQKEHMGADVIAKIVCALEKEYATHPNIKKSRITWFGGEPLLAYDDVIKPLQLQVEQLCKKNGIEFTANLITNGYYLTKDKFEFLFKENHTRFVQITFDGTEEEYCKRKGTKKEAYHRVVENILELSQYCHDHNIAVKINIRLNVDNKNYDTIKMFVDQLKRDDRFFEEVIFFSLAKLRSYDFCANITDYCTSDEYEKIQYDFESYIGKKPYVIEPKTTFCGQHCMNVFCVGPKGELYKCEHDFGVKEHAVGTIENGLQYGKYFDDFMYQELPGKCKDCKILPVCMGGCPHRRLELNQEFECEHSIENLKRSVRRYIMEKGV